MIRRRLRTFVEMGIAVAVVMLLATIVFHKKQAFQQSEYDLVWQASFAGEIKKIDLVGPGYFVWVDSVRYYINAVPVTWSTGDMSSFGSSAKVGDSLFKYSDSDTVVLAKANGVRITYRELPAGAN